MYYVYVLWNKNENRVYIGYTNNIEQRVKQHSYKSDVTLVYYEAYQYEGDARNRERKLKMYGSAWRGLKQRLKKSLR